ncbi:MAG: hypothetical protein RIA65_03810 [Woeseia sp.]
MHIETLRAVLGWTALINMAVMLVWFLFFVFAHDFMHRLHGRWFDIPRQQFDSIHYAGMALFKFGNILFFIAPYLALRIVA